ncbi:MAG: DNA cytosine methyltransferase [Prevotella sp.]|nr:DNA cytosine methyltransferase [Prevotella sp.]
MKVVDLFCGCGGLSLGFQKAGYNVVAAYDKWEAALNVYRLNFGHPAEEMDLSDVQASATAICRFEPDMIIGGPPCQDFSSAGKRNEEGGRGDLTIHYAQIISLVRPKWFVMENVERIIKTQKLIDAKTIFKEAGYGLSQRVLDASYCGVPQKRKRFFLIGKLHEMDNFMNPFINSGISDKPMTMRDYFGESLGINYYYRHPRSYVRRGIFSIDEPSPTIRGVNRPMPAGYQIHTNDPVESKEGIRPLTTLERSYIQTFPRDFKFVGNKTEIEQMIGNAVPVNLAKFVATAITKYIAAPHLQRNMEIDFEHWEPEERLVYYASEPLGEYNTND